jgi:hypothetical protein
MQAERFQHQIVGAAIQAPYPRLDLLARGQDQYGEVGVKGAYLFKNLLAVFDRHIEIENGQVRQLLPEGLNRRSAVLRQTDAVSVCLKATAQEHSQRFVVFCYQ